MTSPHSLFNLLTEITRSQSLGSRAELEREANEAYADQPASWQPRPTEEEINRYCAEQEEVYSEGRAHKNTRPQRHE
jgi:hypothetical protein